MERRTFGKALLAATALGSARARAQVRELRLVQGGGLNGDAIDAAYSKPFTAKTGIKVVLESPNPLGKLRALVESRSGTTQLFELGTGQLQQARTLGLVEKLDWSRIDPLPMFPEAKDDYGMGYQYYSTLMCWREGAKPVETWAQFFDAAAFPGKRTLPNDPVYVLPFVLIASGVPMDKLYPLDVDAAFRRLETVKKDVSVWWKAGAQPPQLLRDNEVQYAASYSGRVVGQNGIGYTYNQANLNIGYISIVKGTPAAQIEAAYKFLREMTDPKNQLVAAQIVPYSGNSPDFERLLPPDKISAFPTTTANKRVQFFNDQDWWSKNVVNVQNRWEEFTLNR